jgi:uncharacterized SAM-binding protein YcdF (DUF218 family)
MIVRALLKSLLLPPALQLLTLLLAWLLWRRWPRFARLLALLSLLSLYLLSTPWVSLQLLSYLTRDVVAVNLQAAPAAQAIVVLGGGRHRQAAEFGGRDTVSAMTLQRLRYAAALQRQTGLPLLVSGGRVFGEPQSEAELMAGVLVQELAVPVRWVEAASRTTAENASQTAALLQPAGISRILLVTHAWHMPRSEYVFTGAGLQVLAAPTAFPDADVPPGTVLEWVPRAASLLASQTALHEILGLWQYRWAARQS